MFLHITLATSLYTVDLTPNFSKSNYIYPYYGIDYVVIAPTVTLFQESLSNKLMLHHYPALGKVQLPISCLDDVSEKWCPKIIQV